MNQNLVGQVFQGWLAFSAVRGLEEPSCSDVVVASACSVMALVRPLREATSSSSREGGARRSQGPY